MKTEDLSWDEIIEKYEMGHLSQPSFCKMYNIRYNQFQYQLKKYHSTHESKKELSQIKKPTKSNSFESVTINHPGNDLNATSAISEVMIYLPNHIRCEIKVDLSNDGFSSLLKALVQL